MLTRAIVEEVGRVGTPHECKLKIRMPIINGKEGEKGATADADLSWASIAYTPGLEVQYRVGDVVVVGFEDNNLDYPIVVNHLRARGSDVNQGARVYGDVQSLAVEGRFTASTDTVIGKTGYSSLFDATNKQLPVAEEGAKLSGQKATSLREGLVKLGSDVVQTVRASDPFSVNGRTFPIQTNTAGQLVVNVPGGGGGDSLYLHEVEIAVRSIKPIDADLYISFISPRATACSTLEDILNTPGVPMRIPVTALFYRPAPFVPSHISITSGDSELGTSAGPIVLYGYTFVSQAELREDYVTLPGAVVSRDTITEL